MEPDVKNGNRFNAVNLATFDGGNGNTSYVAYRGKVYDVSKNRFWQNGRHMLRHRAGTDLTSMMSQAPHNEDVILSQPVVGEFVEEPEESARPFHVKVFFVMAYINLSFVGLILLILALWRWW
ncbi:MAG: hypothetical protein EH225_10060 [Calditrichaeota bacterium]|nr:MAG: hypothetical protein EH225_10060 [Calditrichota bacterium]